MPLELNMQFNIVIYSILAGIITGVLFDIYRVIRGLNSKKILTIIEDILFWILISIDYIYFFIIY